VEKWQSEEQAAITLLQDRRRDEVTKFEKKRALRAADSGAIKDWLILAPISLQEGWTDGAAELDEEQIEGEALLRPTAGERERNLQLVWRETHLDDYLIDFLDLLGGGARDRSLAYAVCYIDSQELLSGLLLKAGADDFSKIYLNGQEIYRCDMARPYVADTDVVSGVKLQAGRNVLVVKVINGTVHWLASVRLTDADGSPVKGIRVTLDPGEN
jgi:hypothetical protein